MHYPMNTMIQNQETEKLLRDTFTKNRYTIERFSADLMNRRRKEALEHFMQEGIPGRKTESYKYTDMPGLFSPLLHMNLQPNHVHMDVKEIFQCDVPELDTHIIFLVNGFLPPNSTPLEELEGKVLVGSLAEAARRHPELLEKHYDRYTSLNPEGLVSLNTAFAQDGLFLYIPDGTKLERPIQVVNMSIWEDNLMIQQRNLFILGKNSAASLIICDHTLAPWRFLNNAVTEIFLDEQARFDLSRVQNENNSSQHISHTFARQETASTMTSNTITLHGGLVRNNFYALLNGEHAENNTYGLYLSDRNQHIDNFSFIDHAAPNCTSNQLFKGVLDDQATGAFTGRIRVRQDAQKTMAYQSNNNILLTDEARINTKPQLEIYADDVKCSHGATVGQLDPAALFYLRSRGINYREARLMLMYAFAHDIISHIAVPPLRERIGDLVDKRLRGELSRCNACHINCGKLNY